MDVGNKGWGMNTHPVLMDTESIVGIRDGRKTQTRRLVKPQPEFGAQYATKGFTKPCLLHEDKVGNPIGTHTCPYGEPGDLLWVREAWRFVWCEDDDSRIEYRAGGWVEADIHNSPGLTNKEAELEFAGETYKPQWRPSIYMRRKASRLTLEVVSVRVERVQAISDNDAYAEGVEMVRGPRSPRWGVPGLAPRFKHYLNPMFNGGSGVGVQHSFQTRWDSINSKRAPWASNPWVFVIEFKPIWQNIDAVLAERTGLPA